MIEKIENIEKLVEKLYEEKGILERGSLYFEIISKLCDLKEDAEGRKIK